jgi:hypothetical protein
MIFRPKTLNDVLYKKIRVMGIRFLIKRIDVQDYLEGSKVLLKTYDTYQTKAERIAEENQEISNEKAKAHMVDVLMAGIVEPLISRKPEEGKTYIEHLFTEPKLVAGLYQEILTFTFGKKKLRAASRTTASLKSTA